MEDKKERTNARKKAESKYDKKREELPRFGGRCSDAQKEQLKRLSSAEGITEKELVFKSLDYYESKNKELKMSNSQVEMELSISLKAPCCNETLRTNHFNRVTCENTYFHKLLYFLGW